MTCTIWRLMLIASNFAVVTMGLFVSFICGYSLYMNNHLLSSINANLMVQLVIAMAVIAVFASVVALVALYGSIKVSARMLNLYVVLMTVTVLIEVAIVVSVYYYRSTVEDAVTTQLKKQVANYGKEADNTESSLLINRIQSTFKCCGVVSKNDYREIIPYSCCNMDNNAFTKDCVSDGTPLYEQGCKVKISDGLASVAFYLLAVASVIAFFEIVNVLFALKAVCDIKDETYV